jgi:glutamate dehydrogenase (NAD(P)+)
MDMEAPACTTGKSEANHGVSGREESTGMGMFYILRNICNELDCKKLRRKAKLLTGLEKKKIVVQGLGNVGYNTAVPLHENGCHIIGYSLQFGSLVNPKGIDPVNVKAAVDAFRKTGKTTELEKLGTFSKNPEDALFQRCDILIPAAGEMLINKGNVRKINAKLILEAANGAISVEADEYLNEKGVVIIPDVLAGTGGLISSYFEFLSNIDRRKIHDLITKWEEQSKLSMIALIESVFDKAKFDIDFVEQLKDSYMQGPQERDLHNGTIETIIIDALNKTIASSDKLECNLRVACYHNAIKKIYSNIDQIGLTV